MLARDHEDQRAGTAGVQDDRLLGSQGQEREQSRPEESMQEAASEVQRYFSSPPWASSS